MDTISIRKVKLNGAVHTWSAHVVAEDTHGTWLFTPKGSLVQHEQNGARWQAAMGSTWAAVARGFLWLMPRDEWWFAAWWIRPDRQQIAIDACTVPTNIAGIWTWTDLELDICRDDRDGSVWVEDEDEFVDSVAAGLIDAPAQHAARTLTEGAQQWLTDHVAPFDGRGWDTYSEWIERGLPPLDAPT